MAHRAIRAGYKCWLLGYCLLLATTAAAQDIPIFSHLGLSAAPDRYVPTLEVEPGQDFTLYVLATGPDGTSPLTFDITTLRWGVLQACCGVTFEITSFEYGGQLQSEGHPFAGVVSTTESCVTDDISYVGSITFDLLSAIPGSYYFAAVAMGPAEDCEGGEHLMLELSVEVLLGGEQTPSENQTWGGIKSLYLDAR